MRILARLRQQSSTQEKREAQVQHDFQAINAAALPHIEEWLPGGRHNGREYLPLNPLRDDSTPGSFSINLDTGRWADFAADARGGDPVSLWAYLHHSGDQGAAARDLAQRYGLNGATHAAAQAAPQRAPRAEWTPVLPVPEGTPDAPTRYSRKIDGERVQLRFTARWAYHDANGALLGYAVRYELPDGSSKDVVPQTYCRNEATGELAWRWQSFPRPRPLYNLPALVAVPDRTVLIVEGEKTADAAALLFPTCTVVTWPGGCKATKHVDWSALSGRRVMIWPDRDAPGYEAALWIANKLTSLRCVVKIILPPEHERLDRWDLADDLGDRDAARWARDNLLEPEDFKRKVTAVEAQAQPVQAATEAAQVPPHVTGEVPQPNAEADALPLISHWSLWDRYGLDRDGRRQPYTNLSNAVKVLQRDPAFAGRVYYDTFLQKIMTDWRGGAAREWGDADDYNATLYMQERVGLSKMSTETVTKAVIASALEHKRNCLTEWLEALEWDGEPRISEFLSDAFGAPSNDYVRSASSNLLIAMVARAERPGCKVDTMVVLEGAQGIKKSTGLRALTGDAWFAEASEDPKKKDFFQSLHGAWLVEIAELDAFSRAEVSAVKRVLTCQSDRFRAPYDRHPRDYPRQGVFAGTTNRDDWHRDSTGGRRFWPIRCGVVNLDYIRATRDQLFAEAVARFKGGATWWEMPAEATTAEQEARRQGHPWEQIIANYLEARDDVTVPEVLTHALEAPKDRWTKAMEMQVAECLRLCGFSRGRGTRNGKQMRLWVRKQSMVV